MLYYKLYEEREEHIRPYFNIYDVEEMYEKVNGSRKGITSFIKDAKKLISRNKYGREFVFKDEEALFELFKERLPEKLIKKKISCWGGIVQLIS